MPTSLHGTDTARSTDTAAQAAFIGQLAAIVGRTTASARPVPKRKPVR